MKTAVEMIGEARSHVKVVSPEDASVEASGGAVFLDVREAEEWQHGHIDGAVAAPRGLVEFFADPTSPRHNEALDPSGRVIVVCASGARAALAAATLQDMGYDNVAVMDGGLKGWVDAGLPINEHEYAGI